MLFAHRPICNQKNENAEEIGREGLKGGTMPGIPPSLPPAIICVVTGVAAKCAKRRLVEAARQLAQIDLTARIAVNAR